MAGKPESPAKKYWSDRVTKESDALDLEEGVFTRDNPRKIALSLKRSADSSTRRKARPFRSAMSMLVFYINRAGRNLSRDRLRILERAKDELRALYGKKAHGSPFLSEGLKSTRDRRFVASHCGGPLKKEQHYQLIKWACDCAEHVLNLSGETIDERLISALKIAEEWRKGKVSVGAARKASLGAIAAAKGLENLVALAASRSVGHAVATAHMADHSLAAADYALKAVKNAGQSVEAERKWQDERLPPEVRGLVLSARKTRKAQ